MEKELPIMAIVHCAMTKLENHQVLSFQSGFGDLKNDRIFLDRTNSKQEKRVLLISCIKPLIFMTATLPNVQN